MPSPSAELAKSILESLDMYRLPVDPFEIARQEGIGLSPDVYSEKFDARIEHFKGYDKYCIYYALPDNFRTQGRVHFSIGHELGHFYLPEHRQRLRDGKMHNSVSDFGSRDPFEEQADEFSADLLMPMELFREQVNRFLGKFCTLEDLLKLANRLGTSITSTARRYCQSDHEPCTIFFSQRGVVRWGKYTSDMEKLGLWYYKYNTPPPAGSKTAALWQAIENGEPAEPAAGVVNADVWFQWPKVDELWEEVRPLGSTGRVITQLVPHRR